MKKLRSYFFRNVLWSINLAGITYTWVTIISLMVFACRTCWALETENECTYYIAIGFFFTFECLLNFICFHYFAYRNRVDYIVSKRNDRDATSIENGLKRREELEESKTMKFCLVCNRTVPKRSHHCFVCNYCVLRNDHHCFVLGNCVGFGNQRYFVMFCFWAIIGGFYGAWMAARYFDRFVVKFSLFGIIDYFFPLAILKWLFYQHYGYEYLIYPLMISFGYVGGCGALVFFIMQWYVILKGLTSHEMYKHIRKRDYVPDGLPWWLHVEQVFGPCWYLNFLFPTPFRNRMDDGLMKFLYDYQMKTV